MAETLGKKIKQYRKLKNYSQETLAEKAELSKMSIRRYETGERQPGIDALKKIAAALDCQVSDIDESIMIIPKFEPRQEDIERYKKGAEARKLIEKKESGETLTLKEQQKIIDYGKQLRFEAKQREGTAKKFPTFTSYDKNGNVVDKPTFTAPSTTLAPQEAYELLRSLIDKEGIDDMEREKVSQQLKKLLSSFKGLNEVGREKAVERIEELYMIPKYIFDNFPEAQAELLTKIPEEQKNKDDAPEE